MCDLELNTPLTIASGVKCKGEKSAKRPRCFLVASFHSTFPTPDAIALLKREGFDMVPVLDEDGGIMGVVTEGNMTKQILSGRAQPNATVEDAGVVYKTFKKLSMNDTLSDLASALDIEPYGECFLYHCILIQPPHSNTCIATSLSTGNHRAAVLCGEQKETNCRWRRRRQERGIEWNGSREEERRQCHHHED